MNGDNHMWDILNVTDMSDMFDNAKSFNGDISMWIVSKVTYMGGLFHKASSFNGYTGL